MQRQRRLTALLCPAGGEFSLFYTNCEKLTVVSFDIRVALYNVRASGYKDFLSVGEDMLPIVFMVGAFPFVDHTMCTLHRAAHGSVLCTSIKEMNFPLRLPGDSHCLCRALRRKCMSSNHSDVSLPWYLLISHSS